jgi:hypothetical protein
VDWTIEELGSFLGRGKRFFSPHNVWTGPGAHTASYYVGIGDFFYRGKVVMALS